jgi:hypothetical protein
MKKSILTAGILMIMGFTAQAQYKKDGTPDMRYRENKETYQNNYNNNNNNYYSAPKETPSYYDNGGQIKLQDGYYKSNGTYVAPHIKTTPDDNKWNNKSNW